MDQKEIKAALTAIRKLPPGCLDYEIEQILERFVNAHAPKFIQPKPEFNIGTRPMTFRNAANAIWNKLNVALSIFDGPNNAKQTAGRDYNL